MRKLIEGSEVGDRRARLKERADAARTRMDDEIRKQEEEDAVWVARVSDIEALCLTGEIPSPRKVLFSRRCPECGGKIERERRGGAVVRACGVCDDAVTYTLLSCTKCDYEWASSRIASVSARGI